MTIVHAVLLVILVPLAIVHFAAADFFRETGQRGRMANALALLAIEATGIVINIVGLVWG